MYVHIVCVIRYMWELVFSVSVSKAHYDYPADRDDMGMKVVHVRMFAYTRDGR